MYVQTCFGNETNPHRQHLFKQCFLFFIFHFSFFNFRIRSHIEDDFSPDADTEVKKHFSETGCAPQIDDSLVIEDIVDQDPDSASQAVEDDSVLSPRSEVKNIRIKALRKTGYIPTGASSSRTVLYNDLQVPIQKLAPKKAGGIKKFHSPTNL